MAERVKVALGASKAPRRWTISKPRLKRSGASACFWREDNPINALLARTLLTRAGCVVDVVQDGEEAVAAAAAAPYDLIFLDIRMPRLDGIAAAARIPRLARVRRAPHHCCAHPPTLARRTASAPLKPAWMIS
ncbi:MAG: response regulator [Terricaulis sp.]